jgi:hypothetical protein
MLTWINAFRAPDRSAPACNREAARVQSAKRPAVEESVSVGNLPISHVAVATACGAAPELQDRRKPITKPSR